MKKSIYILIGAVIIFIVIGGWFLLNSASIQPNPQGELTPAPTENVAQNVALVIDEGQGTVRNFQVKFKEGITAFDALKSITDETGLALNTKTYDIGILVQAIGDKEGGQDGGKYWMYYVNGQAPTIAADKEALKPGDKVEFKFEKSPY
jgi:hypothetical protein